MSTTPTTALETTAYRQKLALHILPNSPALASRYASRLRKLSPSLPPLTPISCPRCGNIFAHGRGGIRVARQALVKECYACGEVSSASRPTSNTRIAFPSVRSRMNARPKAGVQERRELEIVRPAAANLIPAPSASTSAEITTAQLPSTKRPKSKGGLQNMLQRNREREMRESEKASTTTGLASFLQGL